MVWNGNQIEAFFTDATQMAVPLPTVAGLAIEGIDNVDDLLDFDDEDLKTVMDNLRKPAGTIPDPENAGQVIPRPSYVFGAKCYKRLRIAAAAVRYYDSINRPTSSRNMHFTNVLKDFAEQWESLKEKKEEDAPTVPTITRALPIVKWTESFDDFLHQVIGHRMVPLAYLIRETVEVPVPGPPLIPNRSFSEEHGSVEAELIARTSHTHNRFRDDNAKLYAYLEVATRSTQYAASIRPHARAKNGRLAYLALVNQYAGKDKWQEEIKKQESFILNRVWKGNSNFSLESFITQHRSAHVSLQRCAENIPHQLPNERTRVIHLLDAIQTTDASLQAALANIRSTDTPEGMMNNFEDASAYLLQFDPVAKNRKQGGLGRQQQISAQNQDDDEETEFKMKPNKGSSGVEFRYYNEDEYNALTNKQKFELKAHRQSKRKPTGDESKTKKKQKANRKAKLFKEQIISCLKQLDDDSAKKSEEKDEVRDYILSVVEQSNTAKKTRLPPPPTGEAKKAPNALQRILNRN
jgi:hypothetical protein